MLDSHTASASGSELDMAKWINDRKKKFADGAAAAGNSPPAAPTESPSPFEKNMTDSVASSPAEQPAPLRTDAQQAPSPAPAPAPPPAIVPAVSFLNGGSLELTQDLLKQMLDTHAKNAVAEQARQVEVMARQVEALRKQQAEVEDRAEKEREELQKKIDDERKQRDQLAKLYVTLGMISPDFAGEPPGFQHTGDIGRSAMSSANSSYIAPSSYREGHSARDIGREYKRLLEDDSAMQPKMVISQITGLQSLHRNLTSADQFVVKHRDAIRRHVEEVARGAGLLLGPSVNYWGRKDAPTTFENFPLLLREYLSSIVRIEHSQAFVLWQFVNRTIAAGVPPGMTTLVPRVRHLNNGTVSSSWQLTPGTPLTGERQNLNGNNISVPIYEWGMGKDQGAGVLTNSPVSIADMITRANLLDLEELILGRIGYNYNLWEDKILFEILLSTTRTVYSNSDSVVTTPAGVVAGGGGQLTLKFLGALSAELSNNLVPPLPDGSYILVCSPTQISQLEADMQAHHFYAQKEGAEELLNMLQRKTGNEYSGRISGYRFFARGFRIFCATSFSTGNPGAPGVQTETLGGTAVTTRTAFAFGADVLGMAVALPMEIREQDDQSFGRVRSMTWKAEIGATGLDVDPARTLLPFEAARPAGAEEQLRVFEVRTSDAPV